MECPKCGRVVEDGAFICPGCDFILDASFLGDDITDDEREQRPPPSRAFGKNRPKVDFGEDAMILGKVSHEEGDEVRSFQSNDAGVSQREVTQARFYVGGAVAQLMNADAIPEVAAGSGQSMRITPFERHVLGFVNGKRSVGRIQKKAAMEDSEFKTALALLADKGFVRLKGYKKQKDGAAPRQASAAAAPALRTPKAAKNSLPSGRARAPGSRRGPPEGDATMVASMEHIEALAGAPQAQPSLVRSRSEGDIELASGARRRPAATPIVDAADGAPARGPAPAPISLLPRSNAGILDDVRFASLQAGEGGNDDDWGKADNASSVFAESVPSVAGDGGAPRVIAATAGAAPAADVGFDDPTEAHSSLASALKDPTGLGDARSQAADAADGAPLDDLDEGNKARPIEGDEGASASFGDEDESVSNDPLGGSKGIYDEVTGAFPGPADAALPPAPEIEEEEPAPRTEAIPRPFTLPSDALSPLPEPAQELPARSEGKELRPVVVKTEPPRAEPAPPPRPMPLPGQALEVKATLPPPMPLPGQGLLSPTAPPQPAKPRPSSSSSVPFELRKKAERIYEQALKDQAEGRTASALMNAKLAMNFDPTVPAYKELFQGLGTAQKGKPVKGPQARELVLFEQASEAEGRGDYARAAKLLEEAIGVNPKAAALYNRLGVVLSIRLKRHDEALAHLKRAIELEPGSIVYMNNFSKVTGLLESVLEKDPKARLKRGQGDEQKVEIKKMRPVKF